MTKLTRLTNQRLRSTKSVGQLQHNIVVWLQQHTFIVNLSLCVMVVVVGLGYLAVVNTTASDSFTVHQLSLRVDDIKESNSQLELSMSEVLSLQHISSISEGKNLIPATQVNYLVGQHDVAYSQ